MTTPTPGAIHCPHCHTLFQVTPAQLKATNGSVRCGACLNVFHAGTCEHLHTAGKGSKSPESNHRTGNNSHSIVKNNEGGASANNKNNEKNSAKELHKKSTHIKRHSQQPDKTDTKQKTGSASTAGDTNFSSAPKIPAKPSPAVTLKKTAEARRPFLSRLLSGTAGWRRSKAKPAASHSTGRHLKEKQANKRALTKMHGALYKGQGQHADYKGRHTGSGFFGFLQRFPGASITTVISLSAFLTAAVYLGYLLVNKNRLAVDITQRGFYLKLCQYLGCTLPPLTDTRYIKSLKLIIEKHSQKKDVLTINTIIFNNAPYPLAFPIIVLEFADLNANPVATQMIKPSEYLGGNLAGARDMPVKTPIRLGFEIADPGSKAVNYTMTFRPDPRHAYY